MIHWIGVEWFEHCTELQHFAVDQIYLRFKFIPMKFQMLDAIKFQNK